MPNANYNGDPTRYVFIVIYGALIAMHAQMIISQLLDPVVYLPTVIASGVTIVVVFVGMVWTVKDPW